MTIPVRNTSARSLMLIFLLAVVTATSLMCAANVPAAQGPKPSGTNITPQAPGTFHYPSTATVEHVILFIGDGMPLESDIACSRYLHGEDRALAWDKFEKQCYVTTWDIDTYNRFAKRKGVAEYSPASFDPLVGYDPARGGAAPYPIDTTGDKSYFLSALPVWSGGSYAVPATDSASAATAIATGIKTDDGNISWASGDPPNGALETIAERIRREKGASIGVVTTVEFSHATPSCFVAHNVNRGNASQIAHEMITITKPDVVIGGGHPNWQGGYISSADFAALKNSSEYLLVQRVAGQDGSAAIAQGASQAVQEGKKLFGIFGGTKGCFDPPVPVNSPGTPHFTRVNENPTLASATEAALTKLGANPKGFFLMVEQGDIDWADHYNDYHWMIGAVWDLDQAVKAAVDFVDRPGDDIDWSNTLVMVTADHCNGYMRIVDPSKLTPGYLPQQVGTAYHYQYPGGEVTYSTGQHTNELVMLYAEGSGSGLFSQVEGQRYPRTSIIDNTDIYKIMVEATGL